MDHDTDVDRHQYGLFATNEQDPSEFYVLLGNPVRVEHTERTRDEIHDIVFERVVEAHPQWTDTPREETFIAELREFRGGCK